MRTDCRYYESRTYPNGDTVRKCDLDLAPEAPWRCPADCAKFERRSDIAWNYGSLTHTAGPDEPPGLDEGAADLLDLAEDILNQAAPRIVAEVEADRAQSRSAGQRLRRWLRSRRRR